MNDQLLTTTEAATALGLSSRLLKDWRAKKRSPVPFIRLGKRVIRYLQSDIDEFIASNRVIQENQADAK